MLGNISQGLTWLSYGCLYLTVLLLWVPDYRKIPVWGFALVLAVIFGLLSHRLEIIAFLPIILLALATYYNSAAKIHLWLRVLAGLSVLVLSIGLAAHEFPGFNNLTVLDHVYISSNAIPFTLNLNFDKTVVGIFILGFSYQLITHKSAWLLLVKQLAVKTPIVIAIVIICAYMLGFIRLDFKIPHAIFIWFITNLLFVCVAEEAFFRAFIQKNLAQMLRKINYGNYLAILIAAILFGAAHYAGGIKYMLLATVAGVGYGWVYFSTKRIEGSILTHFSLNLTHFLFFTYPALSNAI